MRELIIDDLGLPTCDFTEILELQQDFKLLSTSLFKKLKNTLITRGLKYPFFVWIDENGQKWTIDGHQRLKVLSHLQKSYWKIPSVPYLEIKAKDKKTAIEEIAYVNSQYAKINPETSLFKDFGINLDELFINLNTDIALPEGGKAIGDDPVYPLIPKWDERYEAIIIICTTSTEKARIETILNMPKKARSYKTKFLGESRVILAEEVINYYDKSSNPIS